MGNTNGSVVRSLGRALQILDSFLGEDESLTLSEISRRTGLSKSTAHRLVATLLRHRYLEQDTSERLRLGIRLFELGSLVQKRLEVRREALPLMTELARQTGETAMLLALDGQEAVCVEKVDGHGSIRLGAQVGSREALHAGSGAKILLAFAPDEVVRAVLSRPLSKLGPNTITDPCELEKQLQQIRQLGWAVSFEERDIGAAGVAAPVFDHNGRVIASLDLAGPIWNFGESRLPGLIDRVTTTAREISRRLGAGVYLSSTPKTPWGSPQATINKKR
jgi:IclR family KDG regulon transcriptional repressor